MLLVRWAFTLLFNNNDATTIIITKDKKACVYREEDIGTELFESWLKM